MIKLNATHDRVTSHKREPQGTHTDTSSARRRQRSQRSLFLGSRFRFHFHFRFRRFCFFWEKSRTAAARSNNTTPAHTGTPLRNPRPPFWGLAHSDLCLGFDSLCALEIQKSKKKTQKCSYLVDRGIGDWGLGGLGDWGLFLARMRDCAVEAQRIAELSRNRQRRLIKIKTVL